MVRFPGWGYERWPPEALNDQPTGLLEFAVDVRALEDSRSNEEQDVGRLFDLNSALEEVSKDRYVAEERDLVDFVEIAVADQAADHHGVAVGDHDGVFDAPA